VPEESSMSPIGASRKRTFPSPAEDAQAAKSHASAKRPRYDSSYTTTAVGPVGPVGPIVPVGPVATLAGPVGPVAPLTQQALPLLAGQSPLSPSG
jgi:hypothetical protein